jgi:hypothetical protein
MQGYRYMAFQPQSNGHQDSTLRDVHCTKHQWLGNEDDYITNDETNHNQDWEEDFAIANFLHMAEII